MPWSKTAPVDPKYRTPEHRAKVKEYKTQLQRDGYLVCAEGICMHPSRVILPGMRWAAGHDPSGTYYVGPVHQRCNASDASRRANARRKAMPRWL